MPGGSSPAACCPITPTCSIAVAGAAHFDVPLAEALALEDALRAVLPGYLVPRFVREVPGGLSKTPIWQLS